MIQLNGTMGGSFDYFDYAHIAVWETILLTPAALVCGGTLKLVVCLHILPINFSLKIRERIFGCILQIQWVE